MDTIPLPEAPGVPQTSTNKDATPSFPKLDYPLNATTRRLPPSQNRFASNLIKRHDTYNNRYTNNDTDEDDSSSPSTTFYNRNHPSTTSKSPASIRFGKTNTDEERDDVKSKDLINRFERINRRTTPSKPSQIDETSLDRIRAMRENARKEIDSEEKKKVKNDEDAFKITWPSINQTEQQAYIPAPPPTMQQQQWGQQQQFQYGFPQPTTQPQPIPGSQSPTAPYGLIPNPKFTPPGYMPAIIPGVSRPVPNITDLGSLRAALNIIKEDMEQQEATIRVARENQRLLAIQGQKLETVYNEALDKITPLVGEKNATAMSKSAKMTKTSNFAPKSAKSVRGTKPSNKKDDERDGKKRIGGQVVARQGRGREVARKGSQNDGDDGRSSSRPTRRSTSRSSSPPSRPSPKSTRPTTTTTTKKQEPRQRENVARGISSREELEYERFMKQNKEEEDYERYLEETRLEMASRRRQAEDRTNQSDSTDDKKEQDDKAQIIIDATAAVPTAIPSSPAPSNDVIVQATTDV